MNIIEIFQMLAHFFNPLVLFSSWLKAIDVLSFFILPLLLLKSWWRAFLVWFGFLLTQITIYSQLSQPHYIEWILELVGLGIIIFACVYKQDRKDRRPTQDAVT